MNRKAFNEFSEEVLMTGLMYGEARMTENSEVDELREYIAIGQVVLNRVHSQRYPRSVKEVILQPLQFTCFNENDPNSDKIWVFLKNQSPAKLYERMMLCSTLVINGLAADLVKGATNYVSTTFYRKAPAGHWCKKMKPVLRVGGHVFLV